MLNLIIALSLLLGAPGEETDLLEAVPSSAQLMVSINNLDHLKEAWGNSPLCRLLEDPKLSPLKDELSSLMEKYIPKEEEEGFTLDRLFHAFSGDIVFYVDELNLEEKLLNLGLLVELHEERDGFDDFYTSFREFVLRERKDLSPSTDTYGDLDLEIFDFIEGDERKERMVIADLGEVVILAVSTDVERAMENIHHLIDTVQGEGEEESILDNEAFLTVRDKAGGSGNLEVYFNIRPFVEMVVAQAPDPEVIAFAGLEALQDCYLCSKVREDGGMENAFHLHVEGEGFIRNMLDCFMGEVPIELFSAMPAEASSAFLTFLDLDGIYKQIMEAVKEQSEEAYNEFMAIYEEMVKGRLGIDPEKDLLELLDKRFGTFEMEVPPEESPAMINPELGAMGLQTALNRGSCFLLGLKDSTTFKANFEKLLRALGVYVTMKKEEFQGNRIFSIQIPTMSLRLNWAFSESFIALSFFPTTVRSFLRLQTHPDQPSLAGREEIMDRLRGDPHTMAVVFTESVAAMEQMVASLKLGISMAALEESDFPVSEILDTLPDRATLEEYFTGAMMGEYIVDDTGLLIRAEVY